MVCKQKKSSASGAYRRLEWEQWLSLAVEYSHCNGDLLVPRSYVTSDGYRLGRWIERQRAMYNGVISSTLSEERIVALEAYGMVWKLEYRNPWDCWMEQVKLYRAEHGDLSVPKDYEMGVYRLGNWIAEQRKKYDKGLLTEEQIAALETCGMIWREGERRPWKDWYQDAVEYYNTFGNLLVPVAYVTKQGRPLGQWIAIQREKKTETSNRVSLTREQSELLDRIGMVWNLQDIRDDRWNRMYQWVSEYKAQNGKLPLWPRNLKTPDGRSMPYWIGVQRTRLSKRKCTKKQAKRLAALGIYAWEAVKTNHSAEMMNPKSMLSIERK